MPRLIWVFAVRTLILLVLSCRVSYVKLINGTTISSYRNLNHANSITQNMLITRTKICNKFVTTVQQITLASAGIFLMQKRKKENWQNDVTYFLQDVVPTLICFGVRWRLKCHFKEHFDPKFDIVTCITDPVTWLCYGAVVPTTKYRSPYTHDVAIFANNNNMNNNNEKQ